ncbi:MAG: helix-turn-helix transcriptional regulator [Pseudonocardia sp.]|nr:helix-turn-helix transcriptional regulator [Pseudonocardia sp.]
MARRLYDLRTQHFPDVRLTQEVLGRALGGDQALSVPTISSWENGGSGKIPPVRRLAAYATFFSTHRSVEGAEPRLLGEDELTATEKVRREGLRVELLRLRDAAQSGSSSELRLVKDPLTRHGTLRFEGTRRITIVGARYPLEDQVRLPDADPFDPDHNVLSGYVDIDALVEIHGHIRAVNPDSEVRIQNAADMRPDDYTSHLVLLGGIDLNIATRRFVDRLDLPVHQVSGPDRRTDAYYEVRDETRRSEFRPVFLPGDRGELWEDVAQFVRTRNPLNAKRTVIICNGIYARGTLGAVRALTDARFRDRNEEYLAARFADTPMASLVMRVQVLGGQTVTPDWSDPSVRLHEWPEPPYTEEISPE